MSKFKTTFSALAKAIPPTEDIKKEAFASLKDLAKLLPTDINPENDRDLLYICANLVAFPCSNANGDAIDRATALKIFKGFEKKFFDVEHNRNVVIGNILSAGFTSFDSNNVVDENTVFNSDAIYNIAVTGYIWKVIAGKLAEFLIQASNENNREYGAVSLSFEVGFDDYDIVIGSKILKDARIISDPSEKDKYEKYLQANDGKGVDEDGNYVYRLLKEVMPLGAGLVTRPASQVKGILAIASEEILEESDKNLDIGKKIGVNIENTVKSSVINNTQISMNIEIKSLNDLEVNKAELFKDEAFAGKLTRFIADEIAKSSEEYTKKLKEKSDLVASVEANKKAAEDKAKDLEGKIGELTAEYNKLAEEANKTHKKARLENRMASVTKDYDLDDASYSTIADDIHDMDDDQYASYMKKMEPLIKDKAKSKKQEGAMKVKDALKLLGVDTDKLESKDLDKEISSAKQLADAFASVKEVKGGDLPNAPVIENKSTLTEKMKNAFGKSVKLNHKELVSKK